MLDWFEIAKLFTLAVLVPLAVFTANWIYRANKRYSQTAAADFILGILIFDTTAVLAAKEFVPFLRSPELVPLITYWHFAVAFISGLVWWAITEWGEPILESYYIQRKTLAVPGPRFPIGSFLLCWISVLILVALHIGFFTVKQGASHV